MIAITRATLTVAAITIGTFGHTTTGANTNVEHIEGRRSALTDGSASIVIIMTTTALPIETRADLTDTTPEVAAAIATNKTSRTE